MIQKIALSITSLLLLSGCSEQKLEISNNNLQKSKSIVAISKFSIQCYNEENYFFTPKDRFIFVGRQDLYYIFQYENSNLYFAATKNGVLQHTILQKNKTGFSFSPYSFVSVPSEVHLEIID